jgi:hypothetical protein
MAGLAALFLSVGLPALIPPAPVPAIEIQLPVGDTDDTDDTDDADDADDDAVGDDDADDDADDGGDDRIDLAATADGREVRLSVSDTGVGIDPADRELIFSRFGRTGPGRERADGTGLGLAIVAAVAHAHRGSVTVDGIPGEGSTFTLVVPRGQA